MFMYMHRERGRGREREREREKEGVDGASRSHIVQEDYLGLCPTERKQDHVASVCKTPSCRFSELKLDSASRGIAIRTAAFREISAFFLFIVTYDLDLIRSRIPS